MTSPAEQGNATISARGRSWRVGVFVAVVGPIVGSIGLLAGMVLANAWSSETGVAVGLHEVGAVLFFFIFFGFLLGGPQAVLAGLWLGWRVHRKKNFGYVEAVLTAILSCALYALVWLLLDRDLEGALGMASFVVFAIPTSLVVRWLLGRLGWIVIER